ncbi:MAG: hypothetical protein NTY68_03285 [Candidatus Micrarchaeota archaeon]|nr:hypothetical protein [Candidatus Micrarchaeota archaeon]
MEILQCRFNGNNACGCKKNVNGKCLCPKRCQHLPATKMKNLCERY